METESKQKAYLISGIIMVSISLAMAALLSVLAFKVKRKVWAVDKLMPIMLCILACSLYALALFFLYENILIPRVVVDWSCT